MNAAQFATTHRTDTDWVNAMGDLDVIVLAAGQRGTWSGFDATVKRHDCNGMYEIHVPGGLTIVSASKFLPS